MKKICKQRNLSLKFIDAMEADYIDHVTPRPKLIKKIHDELEYLLSIQYLKDAQRSREVMTDNFRSCRQNHHLNKTKQIERNACYGITTAIFRPLKRKETQIISETQIELANIPMNEQTQAKENTK